jgi:hypothetical protein
MSESENKKVIERIRPKCAYGDHSLSTKMFENLVKMQYFEERLKLKRPFQYEENTLFYNNTNLHETFTLFKIKMLKENIVPQNQ